EADDLVRLARAATLHVEGSAARDIVEQFVPREPESAELTAMLVELAVSIDAGRSQRRALIAVVAERQLAEEQLLALVAAARESGSSRGAAEVLLAILEIETLPRSVLVAVRDAGAALGTSSARAAVNAR